MNHLLKPTDEAWVEGIRAREQGKEINTCPYPDGELMEQWTRGYSMAAVLVSKKQKVIHV